MTPGLVSFGTQSDGRPVDLVRLSNGTLSAAILTRGAILQDLRLAGIDHALTLGSPDLAAYEGPMRYFGAVVAPVANRLRDGRAPIDGTIHDLAPDALAPHALHSGATGSHSALWTISERSETAVTLSLELADGLGGYPGHRHLTATYALDGAALRFAATATTDRPTLINIAHHGYWNLDGGATWHGHALRMAADHVLPVDDATLPTGEIRPVEGTGYDFRAGRRLDPADTPLLDHNFCLSPGRTARREVLWLTGAQGVAMTLETTEPGLQVFDAAPLDAAPHPSHRGPPYGAHAGLALEPQLWPDAPNHAGFPDIALHPGETYRTESIFRFRRT